MSNLVEVGAQAMCNAAWAGVGEDWSLASDEQREEFRLMFRAALSVLEARIEQLERELARAERNRDMWRGQCERQAAEIDVLRSNDMLKTAIRNGERG